MQRCATHVRENVAFDETENRVSEGKYAAATSHESGASFAQETICGFHNGCFPQTRLARIRKAIRLRI